MQEIAIQTTRKAGLWISCLRECPGRRLGTSSTASETQEWDRRVNSWVGTGPNEPIEPKDVETAIDEDTLTALSMQTGLSRDELIARITKDLPEAVDKLTPKGELPAATDEITLLDQVPPRSPQQ